ncbi:MAG: anti-sigma factor antagonist [Chloroflexota bacterium]|nr:anti-sigma factor antagonist [Chloroflexota bacterium]
MAFDAKLEIQNDVATITLTGELDASVAGDFRNKIEEAAAQKVTRLVLMLDGLEYMSSAGLRTLVFAKQKMGQSVQIYVIGASEAVSEPIHQTGFHYSVIMMDTYQPDGTGTTTNPSDPV